MFDTMTLTKTVGAFCGMFLIFLLGNWGAELIYHSGDGHKGEDHHQAYTIQIDDGEADEAVEVVQVAFSDVYASADPAEGEKLWRACRSCHALEAGKNGTGPYLYGIVGRDVSAADGFDYSGALVAVADVWTPENLSGFLEDPRNWAPGTRMAYNGMDDIEDRANLIAWLDTLDD